MGMFRRVSLPPSAPGHLLLHSMPGRREPIDQCWAEIRVTPVHAIVCLASDEEIAAKSPSYASAVGGCSVPCERWVLPVEDYGVPSDEDEFLALASQVAESLKTGRNILVHCGAGIGRTGTFAVLVLLRLRVPVEEALRRVNAAGSSPETPGQRQFLERMRANMDG